MTDDIRHEGDPLSSLRSSACRKYALWAAQALVVLVVLDGIADIVYPAARAMVLAVLPAPKHAVVDIADRPAGWENYRERAIPGVGMIVEPIKSPELNVDIFGRRSTGNAPRNGSRGVFLGSSQAFGYHVTDNATVAAAIERRRAETTVANIAGPLRTAAESMANLRHVAAKIDAPDFGILLFSNVESFLACQPKPAQTQRQPALIVLPARVLRRLSTGTDTLPCATPEGRAAVVERSIYELRAALAYGRAWSPHFVVVIAPLIYGNDADAAVFRRTQNAPLVATLDKVIRAFRARLAAENMPGVIDLSAAFDADGNSYFIDSGSHFGRAGADRLAGKILERLPENFFGDASVRVSPLVAPKPNRAQRDAIALLRENKFPRVSTNGRGGPAQLDSSAAQLN